MKTDVHILSYLAQCFIGRETFQSCKENQNTLYVQYKCIENRAVNEIMWKNIAEPDRPQMTIWRMRIACCISKATDTHSEYVILLFHCKIGCTKVPQCYVIHTLSVLFDRISLLKDTDS